MADVPRNSPPGRLSSALLNESLERDLGLSDSQTAVTVFQSAGGGAGTLSLIYDGGTLAAIDTIEVCGPVVVTELSSGYVHLDFVLPIQTLELVANPQGSDELVRQSMVPYDVSWATEFRYVIYYDNTNAPDLRARYYDGTTWQNVGTDFNPGATGGLTIVSDWITIPGAWKAVGDALCRVDAANEPDVNCDIRYAALQFRRSCSVCSTLEVAPSCGTVTVSAGGTLTATPELPE